MPEYHPLTSQVPPIFVLKRHLLGSTACSRKNTGSHLITEVKSFWAGLTYRMGNHPRGSVLYAFGIQVGIVILHLYPPPTCVIVCGLSFSRSQPTPVFLPLQNRLPVKIIWSGCCAPGSCMTVWRQPEVPFIGIRPILSELRNSALRAASKGD